MFAPLAFQMLQEERCPHYPANGDTAQVDQENKDEDPRD